MSDSPGHLAAVDFPSPAELNQSQNYDDIPMRDLMRMMNQAEAEEARELDVPHEDLISPVAFIQAQRDKEIKADDVIFNFFQQICDEKEIIGTKCQDIGVIFGTIGGAAAGTVTQAILGNHNGFQYIIDIHYLFFHNTS